MPDLREYEMQGFNPQQLRQIEDALNQGVDITEYVDPSFDWMQMEQVKLGLIEGLDVTIYADVKIPASRMEHIREKREIESGRTEIQEHAVKQNRLKSWAWRLRVMAIILIIAVAGYYGYQYYSMMNQELFIEFMEPEVNIEYGQIFAPAKYIKAYTQDENVELVLPESVKMDTLGEQTIIYQIKNPWKTKAFELIVNTVDTVPPVITLNAREATLTRGEDKFTPAAYIVSASDNVEGDLTSAIEVKAEDDENDQTVLFIVKDSSGNETTEKFQLHWKNPPEPEIVYVEKPVYVGGGGFNGGSSNTYSDGNNQNGDGGNQGSGAGHGTQYFMFSDGYDLDSGYVACTAAMSQIGYGSCSAITGADGLYTGYQLNY